MLALDQVVEQIDPAIFIFKDFHPFLAKNNFNVTRRLKEIGLHLKNSFKTVVLVSSVLEIPPEFEKEITVLGFPLPSRDELAELLDRIVEDVKQFENVQIDFDEGGRERLLQAARGLTLGEAENVFAKTLVNRRSTQCGRCLDGLLREAADHPQERAAGVLRRDEDLDDVGGLDDPQGLARQARRWPSPRRRTSFGLPSPKGILLLGVQGCGKSLCAKAVASLWQMPLLRFDVGRMFGSLVGSSEENIRRAITVAEIRRARHPLGRRNRQGVRRHRAAAAPTDGGTTARVFGTFLTWLSEKTAPVFVIATANDISDLPPELLRKGRFDEIFFVDLPSPAERRDIFRIHFDQARPRPGEVRHSTSSSEQRGVQRRRNRGGRHQRAL